MKNSIVDESRIYSLNEVSIPGRGDIIYIMSREQRLDDNWSFFHALSLAGSLGCGIEVWFIFDEDFQHEVNRRIDFMIQGLQEIERRATELCIPFRVFAGQEPSELIVESAEQGLAAAFVCDFNPLRSASKILRTAASFSVPFMEVDGHNIVPCRIVSPRQEYGAHTLRKKIEAVLPKYLAPYPAVETFLDEIDFKSVSDTERVDWEQILNCICIDNSVEPVDGLKPGYQAGMNLLDSFISDGLASYNTSRNDPTLSGQSELSPYLHFGHISAQTASLRAAEFIGGLPLKGGFLDEIIVRRELSDNYCLHNESYDSFEGFPSWAKHSLNLHSQDKREHLYELSELDNAETHDQLWNAAQNEMTRTGKMHGYMRMYWAKKILEWSPNASEAMKRAVHLNDRYSLDGKDPNGYAGCAWSIGGLHDRAWAERPVFGKVRYMNERGCRRKFDTELYIEKQGAL